MNAPGWWFFAAMLAAWAVVGICTVIERRLQRRIDELQAEIEVRDLRGYTGSDEQ